MYGSVALLDALGFKGIWQREDPRSVLNKLTNLESDVMKYLVDNGFIKADGNVILKLLFFSDSVFILCWPKEFSSVPQELEKQKITTLAAVTYAAGIFIGHAFRDPIPLAYRGCVASGEFEVAQDRYVIGKAIDDVAMMERKAEGAFVWLLDSALKVISDHQDKLSQPDLTQRYSVPIKGKTVVRTRTIDPVGLLSAIPVEGSPGARWQMDQIAKWAMIPSKKPDVRRKQKNTMKYYRSMYPQHLAG